MKLLIEIPEEQYRTLTATSQNDVVAVVDDALLIRAIENGIPLPKYHGRLIDADVAADGFEDNYELCIAVNDAPTIIPATRNEFFNFDAPIIKKQTATKEGD